MTRRALIFSVCWFAIACGSSPTAPTTSTTPSTPTTASLTGTVVNPSGQGITGATIQILDGANAGKTTTSTSGGAFSFAGLTSGNANLSANAPCYNESRTGIFINGTNTAAFTLPFGAPFTRSGSGNNVFDMPTCVSRIHIVGSYSGFSSNFIVHIGGAHIVNDLLGTFWGPTVSDGTYLTTGGTVEIIDSLGVNWSFTQVR